MENSLLIGDRLLIPGLEGMRTELFHLSFHEALHGVISRSTKDDRWKPKISEAIGCPKTFNNPFFKRLLHGCHRQVNQINLKFQLQLILSVRYAVKESRR